MLMHCGVVIRFLICLCLVRFTVAKCYPQKCGSMSVSYPFWINNSSCGYPGFHITCQKDKVTGMLAPFFYVNVGNYTDGKLKGNYKDGFLYPYKIIEIGYTGFLVIDSYYNYAWTCDNTFGTTYFHLPSEGPFTISNSNKFVVVGCNTSGTYSFGGLGEVRCVAICDPQTDRPYCRYGCCEINLPNNWPAIDFTGGGMFPIFNSSDKKYYNECGFSTIFDPSTFKIVDNRSNIYWGRGGEVSYGLRLNWGIGLHNCSTAKATTNYSCSSNGECIDSPSRKGHVCRCLPGYEGNGYFNGTDIDECSDKRLNMCVGEEGRGMCVNSVGSYNCSCAKGYQGDGFVNGTRCISPSSNRAIFPPIIGSVISFVVVCLAASFVVWWLKKRHLKVVEAKYFQQLQQYIASRVGRESLRMFSAKELARASNNYSKEMVLGSGGFGTVFKGILLDDTLVAIKQSKQALNLEDDHEFLNEITILSQINHKNIVKLLGCCIQAKFPLLVSEFIPNGTLFEHLHSKEGFLSWASRLQIAIETAEALAYLHSGASQPIFHRDVKSSNILLNERLSPKLADFGISRLISASNNTHLTTSIVGTRGYLDPEYFQTFQLTEKSDVYSFGVVLVELLTSRLPICAGKASDEWSLSSLFLSRLNQNRLKEILDSKVLEEGNLQQMEDTGRLARECLHLERRKRPYMKEVVEELFWIRGGTRKTKFHDSVKCDDAIFEDTKISREASQTSYEFRSHSFPSAIAGTSEEPFSALIEMSTLSEQIDFKGKHY
ncbi:wall-associated receptor kinase 2 isoform X2 [Cryptomeria japonica]|uniref:wall-associated receptor kinase 2 isoform X2 n=1 Tax=Cryptomeria japonica TaxID=3369 RepID=UPI0025ABD544|nr:wall-associated receptor kinase 2 isoform X2 [Cryptomeria japonica]